MIDTIINVVCCENKITKDELILKTRRRHIVKARQVAMFLSKKYTNESFAFIGKQIGNKDSSTVIHAVKTVLNDIETNNIYRDDLIRLENQLKLIKTKGQ